MVIHTTALHCCLSTKKTQIGNYHLADFAKREKNIILLAKQHSFKSDLLTFIILAAATFSLIINFIFNKSFLIQFNW